MILIYYIATHHQACYGIKTVPVHSWFCEVCLEGLKLYFPDIKIGDAAFGVELLPCMDYCRHYHSCFYELTISWLISYGVIYYIITIKRDL